MVHPRLVTMATLLMSDIARKDRMGWNSTQTTREEFINLMKAGLGEVVLSHTLRQIWHAGVSATSSLTQGRQ